jgi:hypothetical protein
MANIAASFFASFAPVPVQLLPVDLFALFRAADTQHPSVRPKMRLRASRLTRLVSLRGDADEAETGVQKTHARR